MNLLDNRPVLLLVDDESTNLQVLRHALQADYRLLFALNAEKAMALAQSQQPDLILLDVMMPDTNGYELCQSLKASVGTRHIPVIFVTALAESGDELNGFEVGAVDYITKPISAAIVRARVQTHLSLVSLGELKRTRLQIIQRLARAAEYKDNETGLHVIRMSHYAHLIATSMGCDAGWAEDLLNAAPMHDIGKIGIPDRILGKPGKLNEDEWQIMRRHPEIGAEIIGDDNSKLMQMASNIALGHHEKWDGSGYPFGRKEEEIPIEARIVALADVFDALTTVRPYKAAWPLDETLAYIRDNAGKHFDPSLLPHLIARMPDVINIMKKWSD